jgi:ABC-type nitrate/sulfonate/bicarbonate transport system permease component
VRRTAQTLGAKAHQVVLKVLVTLALPTFTTACGTCSGWPSAISARRADQRRHGLGYLSWQASGGPVRHIILILMIIGVLAYGIDRVLFWFQRGLFPYRAVED